MNRKKKKKKEPSRRNNYVNAFCINLYITNCPKNS